MAVTDIARRVYNHLEAGSDRALAARYGFLQAVDAADDLGALPKVNATFSLINRKHSVHLAEEIDIDELRAQLEACAHAEVLQKGDDLAGR